MVQIRTRESLDGIRGSGPFDKGSGLPARSRFSEGRGGFFIDGNRNQRKEGMNDSTRNRLIVSR